MGLKESKIYQLILIILMTIISAACIIPFVLLIASSFTDQNQIIQHGYNFYPKIFSMSAYSYLGQHFDTIFHAYGITVFITIFGTATSLAVSSLLAYALSRRDLPL